MKNDSLPGTFVAVVKSIVSILENQNRPFLSPLKLVS